MSINTFDLNELKLAVINEDFEKLRELSNKKPSFSSIEEAKEILGYINLATKILENKKKKLLADMNQLKKIKNYTS